MCFNGTGIWGGETNFTYSEIIFCGTVAGGRILPVAFSVRFDSQ